jgi:hypothetical protein
MMKTRRLIATLAEMNRAAAHRWRDFEDDASATVAPLRKSLRTFSA